MIEEERASIATRGATRIEVYGLSDDDGHHFEVELTDWWTKNRVKTTHKSEREARYFANRAYKVAALTDDLALITAVASAPGQVGPDYPLSW